MNDVDFPLFPAPGKKGPQVCEAVRVYLAVVDDLPFEQVRILSEHVQECPDCAREFRHIQQATHLIRTLPESSPSARVDEAILAAIKSRSEASPSSVELHPTTQNPVTPRPPSIRKRATTARRWSGALALAAALILLILGVAYLRGLIFSTGNNALALQLPNTLSWNGYVLHYTQTMTDKQGAPYQVEVYQDLATNQMHIESTMENKFDVVVVTDEQNMTGKDMMHHVAETGNGVESWAVDGSMFNLSHLRQDLDAHRMTYLGKETFQGREVFLLHASDGQVLLLDAHYFPVNVLRDYQGPGTGTPIYSTFDLMKATEVSSSLWNMQVPSDFHMGHLPARS